MAVVVPFAIITCCFGCFFQCGGWAWWLEQEETMPSSLADRNRRKLERGVSMTARVICLPWLELMLQCGFIQDDDDGH